MRWWVVRRWVTWRLQTACCGHVLEADSSRDIPDKLAEGNEDNREAGIPGSLGKTVNLTKHIYSLSCFATS